MKSVGNHTTPQQLPEAITEDMEWVTKPEEVLEMREGPRGKEFFIKWIPSGV